MPFHVLLGMLIFNTINDLSKPDPIMKYVDDDKLYEVCCRDSMGSLQAPRGQKKTAAQVSTHIRQKRDRKMLPQRSSVTRILLPAYKQ